jgi:hypothetical protein
MWSEVQGEMQGEMWSEARSRRRSVRRCGAGWGGKRREEAKMACEITSDAILPI